MRLANFILANREQVLTEWETFARSCAPASGTMNVAALRDHASAMLTVIAADLATPQDQAEQSEKSKGNAPDVSGADTAAEEHGAGRAESGFTVEQMVAEYRALRASVIRLWTRAEGELTREHIDDLTRFNEAIDQSLAESISRFNGDLEQAKETFIAILGHDLRLPLGAIYTSATFMIETGDLEEPNRTLVARIAGSAKRTVAMVGDLLDFTRSRLGDGIPIVRAEADLAKVVREVVDEVTGAHPNGRIRIEGREALRGQWDAARMSQALSNLIGNAVEHGADGSTVCVDLRDDGEQVAVAVHNRGQVIAPEELDGIFNPMKGTRSTRSAAAQGPTGGLGLGLYIAERIVSAHGGEIAVESTEAGGTTFTVRVPRRETQASGAQ